MTTERALKGAGNDGKLRFLGVVAREMGCSEEKRDNRGKYEATRSRNDGFGSGARNAMEKSVEVRGELGVTMIAGSGDFSSTKGKRPKHTGSIPSNAYVLSIAALPDCYAVAASSPADTIHLYAKADLRLLTTLRGHPGGTTSIRAVNLHATSTTSGPTLTSCGKDGYVRIWDLRSKSPSIEMRSPNGVGLLSFDVSLDGHTIATGSVLKGVDASIDFWDARKPTIPIFSHTSTHSDDVTSLHFHPTIPDRLLSASSDGLLSITNTAEQDEDEAVEHVGNWGCSVAQAGWYHDGVWAASDMDTFSLWTPELDKVMEPNFKKVSPCAQYSWEPDYLIGCYRSQDQLIPIVGSNSTYPSHHNGIVRSLLVDDVLGCLVTGGEDGTLNLWELTPSNTPSSPSKSRRKRKLDREREADEVDVDRVRAFVQEIETEVTLATFRPEGFTSALMSIGHDYSEDSI
ncbi:WD40 repeat-like protein [Thelephora ganbajun]|uniref:WD40 repeat-like protein n=1 Tax=Thelephora ganbajun TaxID=370292 RepID=A0ACB6ZBX0_THEGA|nr:WD40 repeat-like protein [Thelephora ganbajun]